MRSIVREFANKPQLNLMDERSLMTPASTARSNAFAFGVTGMSAPFTPQSSIVPNITLPTPRRLSESRDYYTAQVPFSGSPRNLKDRL